MSGLRGVRNGLYVAHDAGIIDDEDVLHEVVSVM